MPGKVKVKVVAGRNLPVMDRSSDTTDAYVEIKLGNTTFKTDVCRKSLNPQWNSEWYRFEMDDAELQDEPLQIRLMDHDTYSANDAIGKVYLDLNPLLLPPVNKSNLSDNSNSQTSSTNLSGGNTMSGWFPVYDTMHGIRGEVNVIVKVELFSDFNKFRQSSCGVQFFNSSTIPQGYHAQVVHGMVEELVVSDDPEYQWIDKIRTPRASNEARQTLFFKLSGEVQRRIGLKVLDFGGNAVIGYLQCFDLEAECGIVVRGLGTAVTLVRLQEPSSMPGQYTEELNYNQCLASFKNPVLSVIPASPLRHSPSEPRLSVGLLSPTNPHGHRSKSPRQTKRLRPYSRSFSDGVPQCDNVSLKVLFEQEDMRGEPVSSRRKIFERLSSFPKRKLQAFRAKSGSISRRSYGRSNSENIASSLIRAIMDPTAFSLDRVPETEEVSESKLSDSESVVHPLRYDDGHLVPISSSSSDTSSSDVDDTSDVSSASTSTIQDYNRFESDTDKYRRVEALKTSSTSVGTYFKSSKNEDTSFYKEEKDITESEASKPNLFVSSMHIVLTPDHEESAQFSNSVKFHKTLSPKTTTLVKKLLRQHSFDISNRERQKRSDTPPLSDMDPFMTFSLEGKDNYTETIFERKPIVTRHSLDRDLKSRPVTNLSFPENVRHLPSVSSGYISLDHTTVHTVQFDRYEKNVEMLSDNVIEHVVNNDRSEEEKTPKTDETQNSYLHNPFKFPDSNLFQPGSLIPGSIWNTNKILPCSKNTYFIESCECEFNTNYFTNSDTFKQCPLNSAHDKSEKTENINFQPEVNKKYSKKQKLKKGFKDLNSEGSDSEALDRNKKLVVQSAGNMKSESDNTSNIIKPDTDIIKNDEVISEQCQSIYSNKKKQGEQITEYFYSAINVKERDDNEAFWVADQCFKTNNCPLIPEKRDLSNIYQSGDATLRFTDSNRVDGAGDQSTATQSGDATMSFTDSNRVDGGGDQSTATQSGDATMSFTDSNRVDGGGDQSTATQTADATMSFTDSNRVDCAGDQSIVTQTGDATMSFKDSNRVDGGGDQSTATQSGDATMSFTDSNRVDGAGDQSTASQSGDATMSFTDSIRVDGAGDQSIVTQTGDATMSFTDSNRVDGAGDQSTASQSGDATMSFTDSNRVDGAGDQSIVTQTGDATMSFTDSNRVDGAGDQSTATQSGDATMSFTDSNRVDGGGDQSIVTQTGDATMSFTDSNRVDGAGDQSTASQSGDATMSFTDSNRVDGAGDQSIVTQTGDATMSFTDSNRVDGAGDQSTASQSGDATMSFTDSIRVDGAEVQSIVTQTGDAYTNFTDSNRVNGARDQSGVVHTGDSTMNLLELTGMEGGDQSKVSQTGGSSFIESFGVEGDRNQSEVACPLGAEYEVRVEDISLIESEQITELLKEEIFKDKDYNLQTSLSTFGQNVPLEVITPPAVVSVSPNVLSPSLSNTDSTKPSLACDASPQPLPPPHHPLVKSRSACGLSTASVLPCPSRTVPEETPAVVVAHQVSPLKLSNTPAIHRRSSDSDLSITPKGNSLTSSGDRSSSGRAFPPISVKLAMKKEPIEGMEFPFLTMNKFPPGFVVHIAGTVTSRSVKLLERVANQEEPEGRDAWWIELRMEVRSHMRAMSCNAVIGYSENTTICDDVCVLSASGTAAVVNVRATPAVTGGGGVLGDTPEPPPPPTLPKLLTNMTTSLDRNEFERSSSLAQSTPLKPDSGGGGSGKTRHHSDSMEQPDPLTSSTTAAACALCHLPFNPASVPLPVTAIRCAVCGKRKVPDLLLATIEPVEGLPTVGRSCLIHVFVTRPKQHARGEMNACVVSDSLPFIEYDIYKQLVNKLKVNGMNAAFGLKTQICLGERMIAAVLSGTAMFLEPLPPPSTPIITPGESWNQEGKLASLLRGLQETVKKNRDFYQVKTAVPPNQESENTAGGVVGSDTDESEDDLPDIDIHAGNKEACVFMVDDEQDIEVVSQLIDPHPPEGFFVTATEGLPGLDDLEVVRNLQMFTQIWRSRIPSSQPTSSMHKHFHKLLQGIYYKLRRMTPCAVGNIQFRLALPEPDEMQISIVGMAVGLGVALRNPKSVRRRTVGASSKPETAKKSDDGDMIFSLEEDQETSNSQSTKTAKPKSPIRPKRQSTHLPPKERYGVDITPLSFIPGGRIQSYLGNLNFFFIRETSCIREGGGLSGFVHSFVAEVLAIIRAHVTALGGNALVAFFLNECIILNNPHKNHGQCLINVGGDVVSVSYID